MEHSMAVRADKGEVTEACLIASTHSSDWARMVALDKTSSKRPIARYEIETTHFTCKYSVCLKRLLLLLPDNARISLARDMLPIQNLSFYRLVFVWEWIGT
jgi:hypothetical protein